jgi:hypothetical protein
MNNLYILTKQEFNSLYRFGKIPLVLSKIINPLNKTSSELDDLIYNEFLKIPFFVGDEEYLIIIFENNLIDNVWLEIETVSEVIPLTKAARNSIQLKFDSRIDFKDARFEHVINRVEEYIDIQERYRGAKAFCNLCQINVSSQDLVTNEVITKSYYNKINGRKSEEFKDDFLVHLLSYDRYDFFPNSDLGFYYDVGQIFAHSKGKISLVGSNFHSFLETHKQELSELDFLQIAQIISNSETIQKFTEQLTFSGNKIYLASALFLKFISDLTDRETIKGSETSKLIKKIRNENKLVNELNLAIYLTGAFFGYQKFYDDLYDLVDLKIFSRTPKSIIKDNKIVAPILSNQIETEDLFGSDLENKQTSTDFDKNNTSNEELNENVQKESLIEIVQESKTQVELYANANEIESKDNLTTQDEISYNEISQKSGNIVIEESNSNAQLNNFSIVESNEKTILDLLFKFIDEGKGIFELKSNRLSDLKNVLSISNLQKGSNLKKDDIVLYIRQSFASSIIVDIKGNKCFIRRKIESGLFNN